MKVIRAGVTTDKAGAGRVSSVRLGPHVYQRGAGEQGLK